MSLGSMVPAHFQGPPDCSGSLRQWLAAGPFTLAMSSGFFSFFAHCGMLLTLEEEGLSPSAVAGSSAGALTGGLWAAGLPAARIGERYLSMEKTDFWDPAPGPGLLRGRMFRDMIDELSPVDVMEDCQRPLSVSAFDILRFRTRVFTEGRFVDAIYASCAVPLMFRPIRIGAGIYADGGIADRPGLAGVQPGTRVFYHHISSRSPWRRKNSQALRIPGRDNMATLVIGNLPRPGPDAMYAGRQALESARVATRAALDRSMDQGVVEVQAGNRPDGPAVGRAR